MILLWDVYVEFTKSIKYHYVFMMQNKNLSRINYWVNHMSVFFYFEIFEREASLLLF